MKPKNQNHIFVDTNIIIGAYSNEKIFIKERQCWNYLTSLIGKKIYVSSLSIAQFISTLQHHKIDKKSVKNNVSNILAKVNIIDFTKDDIDKSLSMQDNDLEDNIQYILAKKLKCGILFTQNKRHYKDYIDIEIHTANEYMCIEQY